MNFSREEQTSIPNYREHQTLVSVNICSVEVNSAGIFFSKVLPGIFVIEVK